MQILVYPGAYISLLIMTTFVMVSSYQKCRITRQRQFIRKHGIESDAVILSIELVKAKNTGVSRKIKLCVQVQPFSKRHYVTELEQITGSFHLHYFQIGRKIRVKYDPRSPKKVMYVKSMTTTLQ